MKTVDFYFPINAEWSEKEFLNNFYEKVKNFEGIYEGQQHLNKLKRSKDLYSFVKNASEDMSKYPLIYFLSTLCYGSYLKAKEQIRSKNDILVFRYFNLEPWPTSTHFWYDFLMPKDRFTFYFALLK